MAEKIRVFEVTKEFLKGNKFNRCAVCDKKFKLKEKIILTPIQEPKKGWATVMALPIHKECYWVADGEE